MLISCSSIQQKSEKKHQPEEKISVNTPLEENVIEEELKVKDFEIEDIVIDEQDIIDSQEQVNDNVQNSNFHQVEPDNDTPCWVNNNPKDCQQFQNSQDILIVGKIETTTNDESQINIEMRIEESLKANYLRILQIEMNKMFETEPELTECHNKKQSCSEYFNTFCSDPSLLKIHNCFEYLDKHPEKNETDQWTYYLLGLLTYDQHEQIKARAIQYIISRMPKAYVPLNDPDVQWIE